MTSDIAAASDNRVVCKNVYDNRISYRDNIDLIINWQGCRARNQFTEVTGIDIHSIGDCVSPRNVEIAIGELMSRRTDCRTLEIRHTGLRVDQPHSPSLYLNRPQSNLP